MEVPDLSCAGPGGASSPAPAGEATGAWPQLGTGSVGSMPEERRRRRRRTYRQPGWIYRSAKVTQVHMRNISPDGAGFICDEPIRKGERLHVKVGLGMTRRPRPAEVMYTRRRDDGRYEVGVRFVRAATAEA